MNTILKCNSCGSIMVVNNKDLWKIRKCTKWYNNGIINKRCFECPNGFKEGRI